MSTSKPHIAAAAGLGALLPFVPDLVKLIPSLPAAVSNALCAVILAVAYAIVPKEAPAKTDQAGFSTKGVLGVLAMLGVCIACATLGAAKDAAKDPAALTRTVLKDAQLACLACVAAPAELEDACAKLKPVCDGLAGVCKDAGE